MVEEVIAVEIIVGVPFSIVGMPFELGEESGPGEGADADTAEKCLAEEEKNVQRFFSIYVLITIR